MFVLCVVSEDKKSKCRTFKTKNQVRISTKRKEFPLRVLGVLGVCCVGSGLCDKPIPRAEEC
jgi:hypothetical protein